MENYNFSNFKVSFQNFVATVSIHKPETANALDLLAWKELRTIFEQLDEDKNVRVVILQGEGKHFCSGIDLSVFTQLQTITHDTCAGRKNEKLRKFILDLQDCVSSIEKCSKPVLAAISGACVGGGLDIAAACDMRYASADAIFSIREIALGIVADLGVLQRLPKIMPVGQVREMAYTGRNVQAEEAKMIGLINNCLETKEQLAEFTQKIANTIAEKSPLSMRGTKEMLVYATDHSVTDGLNYVATWNAGTMLSNDLAEAVQAMMEKRKAIFD
jgi:enoyl-CoA hydratase